MQVPTIRSVASMHGNMIYQGNWQGTDSICYSTVKRLSRNLTEESESGQETQALGLEVESGRIWLRLRQTWV